MSALPLSQTLTLGEHFRDLFAMEAVFDGGLLQTPLGSLQCSPDPLAGLRVLLLKGGEWRRRRW